MKQLIQLVLVFMIGGFTNLSAQTITYDFEEGVMPEGFTLINADMLIPNEPDDAVFADSAWIVIESGLLESFAAVSLSWYVNDAGPADDWMILPKITINNGAELSWTAQSTTSSGNFPDSYQVLINTGEATAEDFSNNGAILLTVSPEEYETAQMRSVSLADYEGQSVHIAFRNITPSGDALLVDDISISNAVLSSAPAIAKDNFQMEIFPNPSVGKSVQLDYALEVAAEVTLIVRGMDGKVLAAYPQGRQPAGNHIHLLPVENLSAGVYLVSVQTAEKVGTSRLIIK
jgi:hypothetical protein